MREYRELKAGEVIQEGDEYQGYDNSWKKSDGWLFGYSVDIWLKYRRPLKPKGGFVFVGADDELMNTIENTIMVCPPNDPCDVGYISKTCMHVLKCRGDAKPKSEPIDGTMYAQY